MVVKDMHHGDDLVEHFTPMESQKRSLSPCDKTNLKNSPQAGQKMKLRNLRKMTRNMR